MAGPGTPPRRPRSVADSESPAADGDGAVEALVVGHMALARALARRLGDTPPGREDLEQAALVALVAAARRFEPGRGVAFASYAVPVIVGELREALRRASGLAGARRLAAEATRLRDARLRLRAAFGREPTMAELAGALGLTRDALAEVVAALAPAASLDEGHWGRSDATPGAADESRLVDRIVLVRAMADLDPIERRVLALRYLCNRTQADVAAAVGLSQSQVSRRERAALHRLSQRLGPGHGGAL